MIKIAICDDNKADTFTIKSFLRDYFETIKVEFGIDCFFSGEELVSRGESYNIIFLDIEMGEMNGIAVGKVMKNIFLHTQIIYVTSYSSYWLDAFSIHAFQYIIKPIKKENVISCVKDVLEYINYLNSKEIVSIDIDGNIIRFDSKEIYYFEFIDRKVKIVFKDNVSYIRTSMKKIYDEVKEQNFGRPHSAFIVNFFHIRGIKGNEILMPNNILIPISQKKAAKFKLTYYDFLHSIYNVI